MRQNDVPWTLEALARFLLRWGVFAELFSLRPCDIFAIKYNTIIKYNIITKYFIKYRCLNVIHNAIITLHLFLNNE